MAYVSGCSTDTGETPEAKDFKAKYLAKYPDEKTTDGANAYNYQAVYFAAAAANASKSVEPGDLKKAMAALDLPGPCGTWKADAEGNLQHDISVVDLTNHTLIKAYKQIEGSPELVASEAAAAASSTTVAPTTTKAP